jgi:acyl-homoserine-lactone acylase
VIKKLIYVIFAIIIAVAIWLYNPLPHNPTAAELAKDAENYSTEIVRDKWGVPHIVGPRDADTSFGLAYAHAEDDFETIQETLAATRGVLARYRGKGAAPTDYIVALLDVWGTVERDYEQKVPADVRVIAEAYAAGLNLYASRFPEQTWQGLAPFKAQDVIAGFVFKTPFFYGLDKTLLELFENKRGLELALEPSSQGKAFRVRQRSGAELGSNAIAVAAHRSDDSTTRLLINSHQPMTGPVAWYEAHLKSDEGLDIIGGVFPGTPVILHGFNKNIGWANTVNHIDLADTYLLTINPDNPKQYLLDGRWEDFVEQEVNINVKLFGPFVFKAKRPLLRSEHGPVIQSGDDWFALRYAGMGEIQQLEQYYRLNQSNNKDEFLSAMQLNALPSINYVYADKDNNIAFVHNAQYPNRNDNWNWVNDIPGDRSDLIWHGYREFSQIPKLVNPSSGLIFNANNTPYSATDGPDNLRAEDFPQSMGLATNQTNRALRLIELNDGKSVIGRSELLSLKFDDDYSVNSGSSKTMQKIAAMDWSDEPQLASAVEHLRKWDLSTDKENKHAALAGLIISHLYQSDDPKDESPEKLTLALQHAVDHLMNKFGRIDPPWGEVNRLQRGDVNLPVDGGPDVLRAIYSVGLEEGETYATHGDTWMALVEWDESGAINADVLHQFGSATLDKNSKHYSDQASLFANKKWRKANFDIDSIRSSSTSITKIGSRQ